MKNALVITTINSPRKEIYKFAKLPDWQLICVGDKKSPLSWFVENVIYLSVLEQREMFPKFSEILPYNCYGRKNIGYLYAIKNKYPLIGETDDDVFPYKNFPPNISKNKNTTLLSGSKFVNIYKYFAKGNVWPRGYPLNEIRTQTKVSHKMKNVFVPIQNSVIDQDSDFDAIYRLISDKPVKFARNGEYTLDKGTYCPLNSQNTFTHPEAYLLLYMPSFVNPRIEDILRGYIAQRIIWEIDGRVLFSGTTTYTSNRNIHDYNKDFKSELPLYLETNNLIKILDSLSLSKDLGKSIIRVYTKLSEEKIVNKEEVILVKEWVREVEKYL